MLIADGQPLTARFAEVQYLCKSLYTAYIEELQITLRGRLALLPVFAGG